MTDGLSVSRLVNVNVNLAPQLARFPNFETCLVLGTSDVIDTVTRMREYNSLEEVGTDFGTNVPEYFAAQLWFGQVPQPDNLLIGRWVKTASAGQLIGGAVALDNRAIGAWTPIVDGAFRITIDGVGPTEVGNLDFSAETNLNGVASVITSGFPGGTAVCTWDAVNNRFVITSQTEGDTSEVSFLTAPNAGTDISGMMAMLANSSGAYEAPGLDAQTALDTVVLFDNKFSSQFYGLVIPGATEADHLAVAAYIEADAVKHFYGVTTQDLDTLVPNNNTCLAYDLQQLNLNRTGVQYSSTSAYAIMSALARILTTNWEANNSTITLMYKQEPLVAAEVLTATQMNALLAKSCNVFVAYNNDTAIIQPGVSSSGQFVDTVIGVDWLAATIQTSCFNLLYGTTTKVPQTDAGMNSIAAQIEGVLAQGVSNGLLAPGVWNAAGFGQIKQGDFLPLGYYIYAPPIASQSQADRAARKSVPFQIAAKLGGAVHEVDVTVNVQS